MVGFHIPRFSHAKHWVLWYFRLWTMLWWKNKKMLFTYVWLEVSWLNPIIYSFVIYITLITNFHQWLILDLELSLPSSLSLLKILKFTRTCTYTQGNNPPLAPRPAYLMHPSLSSVSSRWTPLLPPSTATPPFPSSDLNPHTKPAPHPFAPPVRYARLRPIQPHINLTLVISPNQPFRSGGKQAYYCLNAGPIRTFHRPSIHSRPPQCQCNLPAYVGIYVPLLSLVSCLSPQPCSPACMQHK